MRTSTNRGRHRICQATIQFAETELFREFQYLTVPLVSKKMKREAVDTLRVLAIDRNGVPAPIGSAAAYEMRSVAVPWGNCTEPSNVKAGGTACPIRWQCPGCSHYRPDPSHLPAIEDQVRSLKANLETARAMDRPPTPSPGWKGKSPTT